MATSGTYTYNISASGLITEALRILGVLEEGSTASSAQLSDSTPAFEMYLKGLGKYGLNLWTTATESITLVASDGTYTPTKKFLKITDLVYRDSSGEDTPLMPLTRDEFWRLSDKDDTGTPTQYYYDLQESQSACVIHIWPYPDSNNSGNGETIKVTGQRYIEDISDTSNTIDIPQEWLETIKYGLATRLAPMYGYPVQERNLLDKEYSIMLEDSLSWDTEQESIYIQPEAI